MENNWHLAKVKLRLGQITRLNIHAKFEDLFNTSAIISNISFEQEACYMKLVNHLNQNKSVMML